MNIPLQTKMFDKKQRILTALMTQHPRLFSIAIALAFGIATITGMTIMGAHTVAYSINHSTTNGNLG